MKIIKEAVRKYLVEKAPPDDKIYQWIKKNKQRFKDRYGDDYNEYLYGRAWKMFHSKNDGKE